MPKKDEDILADRLVQFGGFGAKWATKFLRDDIFELFIDLKLHHYSHFSRNDLPDDLYQVLMNTKLQPAFVLSIASTIFRTEGELLEQAELPNIYETKGLIGAGFAGKTPVLVQISVTPASHRQMHVTITGRTKEGFIQQHAGQKAAQRVTEILSDRLRDARIFCCINSMKLQSLANIQHEVTPLAQKIQAPLSMLPTFGATEDFARPHIEVDACGYHVVVVERGEEQERRTTFDYLELLYWIFCHITFEMALPSPSWNRKQIELLKMIHPDFAARRQLEREQSLHSPPLKDQQ